MFLRNLKDTVLYLSRRPICTCTAKGYSGRGSINLGTINRSHWFCRSVKRMACSRFEYVKTYEANDNILPNVWIVVRLDGKGFHKFSKLHDFQKPNDANALNLMNHAAQSIMEEFRDCILAYGQSDEYSFIFHKKTNIFDRRASKILSLVVSLFTSAYVRNWTRWMSTVGPLKSTPFFDGRIILYPSDENLRDYLSWRQADVHINNLYNTAFWNLVLNGGCTNQEAEAELRGTSSAQKNEILFSKFNINYNNLPVMFRKGTILLRKRCSLMLQESTPSSNSRQMIVPLHVDMIGDRFWKDHPELLGKYSPGEYTLKIDDAEGESGISNENSESLVRLLCRQHFPVE